VVQDRKPAQIYQLERVTGCGIIGARRMSSARLHRPRRATSVQKLGTPKPAVFALEAATSVLILILSHERPRRHEFLPRWIAALSHLNDPGIMMPRLLGVTRHFSRLRGLQW
jgi:hypothetical protein